MGAITTTRRLPRYTRAHRQVSCALTVRDLDILALVASMRMASSDHVRALISGSSQNILRRLQKLFHVGFLDRIRAPQRKEGGSAPMIYAATNKGLRELQKAGRWEETITATDLNAQNRDLHDLSVHHQVLISHIRSVLTAACQRQGDTRLVFWREGRDLYDRVDVALDGGYARLPVAPDAFFALQDAKGRMHCLLEADRGTMTVRRFTLKLKAYAAYWQERKHVEKFGIQYFRVLSVTTSPIRARNLAAAAERERDVKDLARMFLFTDESRFSLERPETIFDKIWMMPGLPDAVSIAGAASPTTTPHPEDLPMTQHPDSDKGAGRGG
jgi:predicted transcriptional regulator